MKVWQRLKRWNEHRRKAKHVRDFKRGFSWASDQREKGASLYDLRLYVEQSDCFGTFNSFDDGVLTFIDTIERLERDKVRVPVGVA